MDHIMVREEVMVQTVTRRRQYQSCQHNDPLLLDQPVVLYSIILTMMMMIMMTMIMMTMIMMIMMMIMVMAMILPTTVRKFCFEFPLRESNDRKTNQQNSFQHSSSENF